MYRLLMPSLIHGENRSRVKSSQAPKRHARTTVSLRRQPLVREPSARSAPCNHYFKWVEARHCIRIARRNEMDDGEPDTHSEEESIASLDNSHFRHPWG
mmetsp:Transcript_29561/g.71888  ORF Transcript_29561/g.71888 Transcript_29561/m.71888 type:complete len:99 (-) Transcript_29561:103-399(-)